VPGKPDESLFVEAIRHTGDIKMPPKDKLSDGEIADLITWVKIGAPWPKGNGKEPASAESGFTITPEQRAFWAFQPVKHQPAPTVRNSTWPKNDIDRFVLAEMESRGLAPSPAAEKRTLIRRATFDLIGLPPTPEEVEAFVNDSSEEAFARVVDRLLASSHYGERWGRHWLDVARYGEDQAHTFQARLYPNGYRYRDWVVKSLNDDLPYNQFVMEQIAGDQLEQADQSPYERAIALGYFALGPVYYNDAGCAFKAGLDELDDRLDTLVRGFMALTISCARCHDHKYDPISQQDYYALGGIFRSTEYKETPLATPDVVAAYDAAQERIKEQEQVVSKFADAAATRLSENAARESAKYITAVWQLQPSRMDSNRRDRSRFAKEQELHEPILDNWQKYLAPDSKAKVSQLREWDELVARAAVPQADVGPATILTDIVEFADRFQLEVTDALRERDELQKKHDEAVAAAPDSEKSKIEKPALDKSKADLLAALLGRRGVCIIAKEKIESLLDEPQKQEYKALQAKVDELKKQSPPKYPVAHSLADGKTGSMKLHIRGNPNRTGDDVPRRFLEILSSGPPREFTQGSGRLELAQAIASPENPLTARVMVNRMWHHHFGRGIVATPSNFGALGERPTHPALLDYLAHRLTTQHWSLKALHREIMLSATYRQSSAYNEANYGIDPDNRYLWRANRRRLDVESWRDALLAACGNLDHTVGGPSGNLAAADYNRRTLYGAVSRHNLDGLLRLFDFPDPNITSEKRTVTTVPLQQLFVLNSDFMVRQAKALAARLTAIAEDDATRVRRAYTLLYARPATEQEVELAVEFLNPSEPLAGEGEKKSSLSRWEQYAQVLLSANEFAFVD
jgi:hypothetical protein